MRPVPTCVLSSFEEPRAQDGHALDAYVQIGSLTKPLTGTILVRLAAAGVLRPDAPVEEFLPVPSGTGITLRHLAEHTSGLPRLPPGLGGRDPYASFDAGALNTVLRGLDVIAVRAPGTQEEYSNLGYAVLGAALSSAAGLPYEELLERYVLAPLGIDEVAVRPPAELRLTGHGPFGRPRRPWTMDGAILPAGGLWATPRAAARLVTALLVELRLGEPAPSWQTSGRLRWHNGATRDASVFAAVRHDGAWVLVHRLTGDSDGTDLMGVELLSAAPEHTNGRPREGS
ncbi:class A beta-lactamase-related serine hydrolase [Streptomyces sp. SDr-06]|uniref:serine hydrolase domain-containing protein n=1 Tax=Streptomyces sp. SDr-06 TaxID=2267702 RepID=UPI000DE83EC6|nr:serine hydrolase domain-containing protein [Streptomyces sp. SDr-06]RCH66854.1 class A beta-lactamase-related serine hydrolase [Streptomyces sp. SDr-06]